MRTKEEIERVFAAVHDAVLKTDHVSKKHAIEYAVLYDLRRALMWVLGESGLSPAEWGNVRAARSGAYGQKQVSNPEKGEE